MLTPDLKVGVGNGLAGVNVEDLEVQGQRDASLGFGYVLADGFARNVCRTC